MGVVCVVMSCRNYFLSAFEVGLEEALLALQWVDGHVQDWEPVTRSWASKLVLTVADEAKDHPPTLLACEKSGQVFLAILNLGRCVLGWPLQVVSTESLLLAFHWPLRIGMLQPLVITKPCLRIRKKIGDTSCSDGCGLVESMYAVVLCWSGCGVGCGALLWVYRNRVYMCISVATVAVNGQLSASAHCATNPTVTLAILLRRYTKEQYVVLPARIVYDRELDQVQPQTLGQPGGSSTEFVGASRGKTIRAVDKPCTTPNFCRQVLYEVNGSPQTIMEAAARVAFQHVPPGTLNECLKDVGLVRPRLAFERVSALLHCYKDEWSWTDVDMAKSLMRVLPGYSLPKPHLPLPADVLDDSPVAWDDIQGLAETLRRGVAAAADVAEVGSAVAATFPIVEAPDPTVDLLRALAEGVGKAPGHG